MSKVECSGCGDELEAPAESVVYWGRRSEWRCAKCGRVGTLGEWVDRAQRTADDAEYLRDLGVVS